MIENIGINYLIDHDKYCGDELWGEYSKYLKTKLNVLPNTYLKSFIPQSEISLIREKIMNSWGEHGFFENISVDWGDNNHYIGLVQNIVYTQSLTGITT
jgi:hypothetical protein